MAKEIKAIQCPQCKSVRKEKVGDHYLCKSCGTEYFLDNDDIHIKIDKRVTSETPEYLLWLRKNLWVIPAFVLFCFILWLLPSLFSRSSPTQHMQPTPVSTKVEEEKPYRDNIRETVCAPQDNVEEPTLLFVVERKYRVREKKNEFHLVFFDPLKEKTLQSQPLEGVSSSMMESRIFEDGNAYLIFKNHNKVYQPDFKTLIAEDVTEKLFGHIDELSSGIASIKFTTEQFGFAILTNSGSELFYFPGPNMLFKTQKDLTSTVQKNKTKGGPLKPFYSFTSKSTDFPNEKTQLIKYWYPEVYPLKKPWLIKWYKDYNLGSGIHVIQSGARYSKKLFHHEGDLKFKDLTPGRLFFDPKIAYSDRDNLYITGKATASPDAASFVQRINTESGEVEWTYTSAEPESRFYDLQAYKNGLIFSWYYGSGAESGYKLLIINKQGKILKELDERSIFK